MLVCEGEGCMYTFFIYHIVQVGVYLSCAVCLCFLFLTSLISFGFNNNPNDLIMQTVTLMYI